MNLLFTNGVFCTSPAIRGCVECSTAFADGVALFAAGCYICVCISDSRRGGVVAPGGFSFGRFHLFLVGQGE